MPTTRKKVIKTVYKNEEDSEEAGDYSDSGSEAQISDHTDSENDSVGLSESSGEDFKNKSSTSKSQTRTKQKTQYAKKFISKISQQLSTQCDKNETIESTFSVKDLTDEDKLLPSVLNLSESESSDDEIGTKFNTTKVQQISQYNNCEKYDYLSDSNADTNKEFKDVWSINQENTCEDLAKKTFLELEQHKAKLEETKVSILNYTTNKKEESAECNVKDLLAQGEKEISNFRRSQKREPKKNKKQYGSDSEIEDWEEVKETKGLPQQGLQIVVDFPDATYKKRKAADVEMMMRRKINRVKKEYQVYMHKVHVLCWIGHGNFVSSVLNDQNVMAAALSLVPSKECYPGERVDMKYVEQITKWYKDKMLLKPDKYENKFRPKAPPLKDILLKEIKDKKISSKKYYVFIFVSMLRALGLQCRIMFNFVTLPLKPPTSELCSLSTKNKNEKATVSTTNDDKPKMLVAGKSETKKKKCKTKINKNISQLDGCHDFLIEEDFQNIMQVDGNDDMVNTRTTRSSKRNKIKSSNNENEDVSPPKILRKSISPRTLKTSLHSVESNDTYNTTSEGLLSLKINDTRKRKKSETRNEKVPLAAEKSLNLPKLKKSSKGEVKRNETSKNKITDDSSIQTSSKYFSNENLSDKDSTVKNNEDQLLIDPAQLETKKKSLKHKSFSKNSSVLEVTKTEACNEISEYFENTISKNIKFLKNTDNTTEEQINTKSTTRARTKSVLGKSVKKSEYFSGNGEDNNKKDHKPSDATKCSKNQKRVSHRDLKSKIQSNNSNDVTGELVKIMKNRIKEAKTESKRKLVKVKGKNTSDEDSDYLPEEQHKKHQNSDSEEDFKIKKVIPRPSTSRDIDRRVISPDKELPNQNKIDVWCEVYVEELEQWIAVDVLRAKVHCTEDIYTKASHPVCYIVGWDNKNYLKDLTRRYVPHWNTVTRKLRAEPDWWKKAIRAWVGPCTPRDREENEQLDKMQLEAPLPKSISEYKNHPLYALKRHLLKFEAIYPPDAPTMGFIRKEPVYARECVYTCRSRDTWLKEAKVVRPGEKPYKLVKARPKWDKLSQKIVYPEALLEVFGPWQVQDYEPPAAENGVVPRNAYGNVELFKDCMLPKGTVHIKLPGVNKVARKLNIDCAPAMVGFDFSSGYTHPAFDGFIVCKEFEEIIIEAWLKDQEEQERKEREKIEARVYGNWKRLIKGLLIRERLKSKYGYEEPSTSTDKKKKGKTARYVVKRKM